jgi:hypothetical protein
MNKAIAVAAFLLVTGIASALAQEPKPNAATESTAALAASSGITPCIGAGATLIALVSGDTMRMRFRQRKAHAAVNGTEPRNAVSLPCGRFG